MSAGKIITSLMDKSSIENVQMCLFSNFNKLIISLIYGIVIELIGHNNLLKDILPILPIHSTVKRE